MKQFISQTGWLTFSHAIYYWSDATRLRGLPSHSVNYLLVDSYWESVKQQPRILHPSRQSHGNHSEVQQSFVSAGRCCFSRGLWFSFAARRNTARGTGHARTDLPPWQAELLTRERWWHAWGLTYCQRGTADVCSNSLSVTTNALLHTDDILKPAWLDIFRKKKSSLIHETH